ncbi:hypothetical protein CVT26_012580 [Gymnopilus dilepis]|uniref:Uncharacterized protein n=1 Tax=Gymnopilus dilepis TaxID=231916 RepID=A0A409YPT4_9AGAR|nr:hypothetical protein CVT26_012580 [Gymnopilus dilepis]
MRNVTGVVKDSLDRAEGWVNRLRTVGIQRGAQEGEDDANAGMALEGLPPLPSSAGVHPTEDDGRDRLAYHRRTDSSQSIMSVLTTTSTAASGYFEDDDKEMAAQYPASFVATASDTNTVTDSHSARTYFTARSTAAASSSLSASASSATLASAASTWGSSSVHTTSNSASNSLPSTPGIGGRLSGGGAGAYGHGRGESFGSPGSSTSGGAGGGGGTMKMAGASPSPVISSIQIPIGAMSVEDDHDGYAYGDERDDDAVWRKGGGRKSVVAVAGGDTGEEEGVGKMEVDV